MTNQVLKGEARPILKLRSLGRGWCSGDANSMWTRRADCIKEAKVLRVSKGKCSRYKEDWWWNK